MESSSTQSPVLVPAVAAGTPTAHGPDHSATHVATATIVEASTTTARKSSNNTTTAPVIIPVTSNEQGSTVLIPATALPGNPDGPEGTRRLVYAAPAAVVGANPYPTPVSTVPDDVVLTKVREQIEYYFSVRNLVRDSFLRQHMDQHGWVPMGFIARFQLIGSITRDVPLLLRLMENSEIVEVDLHNETIRCRTGWEQWLWPQQDGTRGVRPWTRETCIALREAEEAQLRQAAGTVSSVAVGTTANHEVNATTTNNQDSTSTATSSTNSASKQTVSVALNATAAAFVPSFATSKPDDQSLSTIPEAPATTPTSTPDKNASTIPSANKKESTTELHSTAKPDKKETQPKSILPTSESNASNKASTTQTSVPSSVAESPSVKATEASNTANKMESSNKTKSSNTANETESTKKTEPSNLPVMPPSPAQSEYTPSDETSPLQLPAEPVMKTHISAEVLEKSTDKNSKKDDNKKTQPEEKEEKSSKKKKDNCVIQ